MMSTRRLEVAAAVMLRADGSFLLAQRPQGKVYAGYWEFPGGKIEVGESAERALGRELREELGIEIVRAYPWITRDYDYAHAAVRLHFFRVVAWHGEPHGREDQLVSWQAADRLTVAPLLPANGPILRALALPHVYGISQAEALGVEEFLRRLERALAGGLRLFQLREHNLDASSLRDVATRAMTAARRYGARMLLNGSAELARELGADGVHLTAAGLARLALRPGLDLVGASCHDTRELAQAVRIGADFVVLGPVQPTPTHPGTPGLGWDRFAQLVRDYPLPVYALGGLQAADLGSAVQAGAHGISMMRGSWQGAELPALR